MKKISFSVVIPVYNAEKYIKVAIESVLNQTYQNFELILVNDNSIDNSELLIKTYTRHNKNVFLFLNSGKGVSSARNLGMSKCKNDYIIFLDADDFLEENCLEKIAAMLEKYEVDIVRFNYNKFFCDKNKIPIKQKLNGRLTENEFERKILPLFLNSYQLNTVWGGAIKRSRIQELRFKENLILGEDLAFNINLFKKAKDYYFMNDVLMNYRQNPNSITHTYNIELVKLRLKNVLYAYAELSVIESNLKRVKKRIEKEYISEFACSFCESGEKINKFYKEMISSTLENTNNIIKPTFKLKVLIYIKSIYCRYIKNILKKVVFAIKEI